MILICIKENEIKDYKDGADYKIQRENPFR